MRGSGRVPPSTPLYTPPPARQHRGDPVALRGGPRGCSNASPLAGGGYSPRSKGKESKNDRRAWRFNHTENPSTNTTKERRFDWQLAESPWFLSKGSIAKQRTPFQLSSLHRRSPVPPNQISSLAKVLLGALLASFSMPKGQIKGDLYPQLRRVLQLIHSSMGYSL